MELRKRYIIHYNVTKYVSRFLQLGHFQFSTRELLVSFIMESEEPCCVKKTVNSFNVWPGLVPFRMFAPRSVAPLVNFGFSSLTAQQSVICGRKKTFTLLSGRIEISQNILLFLWRKNGSTRWQSPRQSCSRPENLWPFLWSGGASYQLYLHSKLFSSESQYCKERYWRIIGVHLVIQL